MDKPYRIALMLVASAAAITHRAADEGVQLEMRRPTLESWFGSAPQIDGIIAPGEWTDATEIRGVGDWIAEFSTVTEDSDLALKGWVKHDAEWLYFGFEITDDLLYGIETERWLPEENPKAHQLTREGFPWFGDEMEILLNASNTWKGDEDVEGKSGSWQMVCNLTKPAWAGSAKAVYSKGSLAQVKVLGIPISDGSWRGPRKLRPSRNPAGTDT